MIVAAAVTAIVVLSLSTVALENYVRWNDQLEECVYFYDTADGKRAQCFVAEKHCDSKSPYTNEEKSVDPVGCYYEPRKLIQTNGSCAEFTEGDLIVLKYQGEDQDTNIGPAGKLLYTFEKPFDKEGRWQTERGDAGEYRTRVTVSDGEYKDSAEVCFTVKSANRVPVLVLKDVKAKEGDTVTLKPECTDPDGDAVKLAFSGDMTSATWKTAYTDAGIYSVTVTCTDTNSASTAKTIALTIDDVNQPPVLKGLGNVTIQETETVRLKPTCEDPEGQETSISYSGKMTSDTWTTGYDDSGEYTVTVTCADESGMKTSEKVKVTVLDKNRPPSITAMVVKG